MKRAIISIALLLALLATAKPASAQATQLSVQATLTTSSMNFFCLFHGCQVTQAVSGSPNNHFVLSVSGSADVQSLVAVLQNTPGVVSVTVSNGAHRPAGNRYIVRTTGGLLNLRLLCLLNLCQILGPLDGTLNQVFLIGGSNNQDPNILLAILRAIPGVLNVELDQIVSTATGSATATDPPPSLVDKTPVRYYGSTVWRGYVNQPAAQIIRLAEAHNGWNVSGGGIIADIDTGVDPHHPVLRPVLLPGYDFTRNQPGGSEMNDLPNGTPEPETPCDDCEPGKVNQRSIAMVDQRSIAMVDGPHYAAFGHGTMVAGVLHLVAPKASLMPLKAFGPDGSGDLSDILRAIYYAAQNHANVVNMSFDLKTPSQELSTAVSSAEKRGLVFVASSGNDGQMEMVYPAGLTNVMGVASTNDDDQRSVFSNYGDQIVWVAAPGEAIVTTYPFGTYAAVWGTSFSAPMVSGGVDLLESVHPGLTQRQARAGNGTSTIIAGLRHGNGRLDLYRAVGSVPSSDDGDN